MGFYTTEPVDDRGVVIEKRAVRFFRGEHRRNARPRQTNGPACNAFHAVVLRTITPGVPLYGYRHLSTELGRWPSRDPIGELGGVNLYGVVQNSLPNQIDAKGLKVTAHSRCKDAITEFWMRNKKWEDKAKALAAGDPPCSLDIDCECCGSRWGGGYTDAKPDEQGKVKVRICEDRDMEHVARLTGL